MPPKMVKKNPKKAEGLESKAPPSTPEIPDKKSPNPESVNVKVMILRNVFMIVFGGYGGNYTWPASKVAALSYFFS